MNSLQRTADQLSRRAVFGRAARLGFVLIGVGAAGVTQTAAPAVTYAGQCGVDCTSACSCGDCPTTIGQCNTISSCNGQRDDCTFVTCICSCCCVSGGSCGGTTCTQSVYSYLSDTCSCVFC